MKQLQHFPDGYAHFIHLRDTQGGGLTIGYRIKRNQVIYAVHRQVKHYDKQIGRFATVGRLAKGKTMDVTFPEGANMHSVVQNLADAAADFAHQRDRIPMPFYRTQPNGSKLWM